MTRTSLHVLANDADLWAVRVPESSDVRIDDGDTLRFGAEAPEGNVAAVILAHQQTRFGAELDERKLAAELARHGYEQPSLQSVSMPAPCRVVAR